MLHIYMALVQKKLRSLKAVDRLAPDPRPAVDAVVGVFLEDV